MTDSVIDKKQIHSICVLCWGLIGDVFVRLSIVEALKKAFPDAKITVIVDPVARPVVECHPACDEVNVYSRKKKPPLRFLIKSFQTVRHLRRRRLDLFVNLYSGGSSPWITRLVNARYRLGFDHTAALRWANNVQVPHPSLCGNWTKALGTVLAPLGIAPEMVRQGTSFYYSAEARQFADDFFRQHCELRRNYVIFNLGAGAAEKCWPVERFVQLAERVNSGFQLTPMVITNPGMESLADAFVAAYRGRDAVIRLPLLSLHQVGAMMDRCNCVVSGDTSLMHMAFGLHKPTLALFTYTRPETVTPADCPHVVCFNGASTETDACGNHLGTREMSVEYVFEQFAVLYNSMQNINP
jgi:ADP-heptose:LPS heptosyltransferase